MRLGENYLTDERKTKIDKLLKGQSLQGLSFWRDPKYSNHFRLYFEWLPLDEWLVIQDIFKNIANQAGTMKVFFSMGTKYFDVVLGIKEEVDYIQSFFEEQTK